MSVFGAERVMTTRDFTGFMDYGFGIDDANGNIRGTAVESPGPPAEVPGTGGQTIQFRLEKVDRIEDLHEATGLSLNGSAAYTVFGGSDKFDFVTSSNFHSYSLFLLVRITVVNTSKHLLNETLKNPGPDLLRQGTDEANNRFRAEFGDLYIKGIETGGEYFAIVEIETKSDDEKKDISNKLEAGGFFGVGGADFAMTFSENFSQATTNESLKIVSYEIGGAGAGAKQEVIVGDLIAKAQNFPEQVLAKPASFRVELQDYDSLDIPKPPNQVDLQKAKDVLQRYESQRTTLLRILNDITYIVNNADQFEPFNASDLGALADSASESLNKISEGASNCLDDIKACSFVAAGVPNINVLPKRKAGTTPSAPVSGLQALQGTWVTSDANFPFLKLAIVSTDDQHASVLCTAGSLEDITGHGTFSEGSLGLDPFSLPAELHHLVIVKNETGIIVVDTVTHLATVPPAITAITGVFVRAS
jgi:hypothetical protein